MPRFNLDKILKYLTAASIITIPLYPKFPFITISGTYVSIRLEDFLIAILGLIVVIKIIPDVKKFLRDRIVISIIIFLTVGFVSYLFGVFLTKTVVAHIGILHWLRRIEYFVPFFAGWVSLKGEKPKEILEFFVKCLMIVTVIAFIYGFGQKHFGWPVIITQNEEYSKGIALRWIPGSHISSTFAGHYDMATYLVLVMPIFFTLLFEVKDWKSRIALTGTIFSGIWLLINAISRISIVSYLVSVVIALLLVKRYKVIPVVVIGSLILFGASSDLVARYLRIIQVTLMDARKVKINYVLPRLEAYAAEPTTAVITLPERKSVAVPSPTPVPVFEDRSTSIRLNIEWPRAIRAFFKDPLLGTGYSSISLATDNDFLRLMGEVGLLGLLSFLLVFAKIIVLLVSKLPLTKYFSGITLPFMAGVIGAIPGVFLNSVFIDVFEASKFITAFLFLLGIAVYLAKNEVNEENN